MHYDWDFAGAEKEFLRAIELDPGYATAHHWYAYDLVPLGRLDDAVAEVRRAQQADPLSVIISRDVGEMLLFAGGNDQAIAQCRRTLEMDPNFGLARWVIASAYRRQGREKESLEEFEERNGSLMLMRVQPEYDAIRSDPRFERLAQRVGAAPPRHSS